MARSEEPHRSEFAAQLQNLRPDAVLNLAFIRSEPANGPPTVCALERHAYSAQTFVPVQGTRYLVVVCPDCADGSPDLERLTAFVAEGDQAVNYRAAVWHAPHTVLDGPGTFIMLRWDCGTEADTQLLPLQQSISIHVDLR